MSAGAGELAEPDFWALRNDGDVFNAERRAILGENDGLLDVVDFIDLPDFADVDLLQAFLNETAAGVGVVVGQLLLDLGKTQAVGDEFVGIDAHLIFAGGSAEAGDVDDVGNGFQILFDDPVFQRLQFHGVVLGIGAVQGEEINLADRAPVGAHLRSDAGGQSDLAQTLQDALAVPGVIGAVFENQLSDRRGRTEKKNAGGRCRGCRSSRFRAGW